MPEEQEPRYQEVIHSIKYAEEPVEEEVAEEPSNELEGVDLNDPKQLADYYMAKSGQVDPDQLEVEKKEEELRADIREVVENKEDLIDYLTNLHASIEVMEERIYELELKAAQKEKQAAEALRRPQRPGSGGSGLSNLPIGLF